MTCLSGSLSSLSFLRTSCNTTSQASCSPWCNLSGTTRARSTNSRKTPCPRMMLHHSNKICPLLGRTKSLTSSFARCSQPLLSSAFFSSSGLSSPESAYLPAPQFANLQPWVLLIFSTALIFLTFRNTGEWLTLTGLRLLIFLGRIPRPAFTCSIYWYSHWKFSAMVMEGWKVGVFFLLWTMKS